MSKTAWLLLPTLLALAACGRAPAPPSADEGAAAKPLLLVEQDVVTATPGEFGLGPVISGSLQPSLKADLRAEVPGIVLEVLHDNGDEVAKGDLLVRLDPTALRGQLLSADEGERAARVSLDQAKRQYERMQSLSGKGLVTAEQLDSAQTAFNKAQSELASAKARAVEAHQQASKAEVRAPFDGIVAGRQVSSGDTAQIGKQLLMVVVPSSMRLEGLIAADQVGRVEVGDPVDFRVNGYPGRTFRGHVERINPMVNEATRQVAVQVALDDAATPQVAGLYAEGRIEVDRRAAITVPDSTLIRDGDQAYVWTIVDGHLQRTRVEPGELDPKTGRVELLSGLEAGAQVLRRPVGALADGAAVTLQPAGEAAVAGGDGGAGAGPSSGK